MGSDLRIDGKVSGLPTMYPYRKRPVMVHACKMHAHFKVDTLEGTMSGKPGDYLIQGVEGELYPCAAAIFTKTYEADNGG